MLISLKKIRKGNVFVGGPECTFRGKKVLCFV